VGPNFRISISIHDHMGSAFVRGSYHTPKKYRIWVNFVEVHDPGLELSSSAWGSSLCPAMPLYTYFYLGFCTYILKEFAPTCTVQIGDRVTVR